MLNQTTLSFSPDGLGGNQVAQRFEVGASRSQPQTSPSPTPESNNDRDADFDRYDDGLVHGHFWAMSSTVR